MDKEGKFTTEARDLLIAAIKGDTDALDKLKELPVADGGGAEIFMTIFFLTMIDNCAWLTEEEKIQFIEDYFNRLKEEIDEGN